MRNEIVYASLFILLLFTSCGIQNDSNIEHSSEIIFPSSVEQSMTEQAQDAALPDINNNYISFPASIVPSGWLPNDIYWLDDTRLIVGFSKYEPEPPEPGFSMAILYDTANQSAHEIIAMDGYFHNIRANEQEIIINTSEKVYVLAKSDFTLMRETNMDIKIDYLSSYTFGGLSAHTDDAGYFYPFHNLKKPDNNKVF